MFTDLITLPAILSAPTQGMTSREIAELTGKRHDHVLRDIDNLVASLSPELGNGFKSDTYTAGEPARSYRQYLLDRDATYCLVAGYDATSRMRIIKRWQELEQRSLPAPMTPVQIGAQVITEMMKVAELLDVPKSFAVQVATEAAVRQSGMTEWARLTTQAACMTNVPQEDVMLEPTELGKYFDLSPAKMNRWLAAHGLQIRVADQWQPTDQGRQICVNHAWSSGFKSGYNLKWKYTAIKKLMEEK